MKQKGESDVAARPLRATLRHSSFRSGRLPNFMIQLRFARQLAFCSVSVFCGFRKLVSLDSIEKKTCLLAGITNNMIISIVLTYKYYCGMPFYENKYNNLMFLIELLKLCFSYYERFQLFGSCQFIFVQTFVGHTVLCNGRLMEKNKVNVQTCHILVSLYLF